MDLRPRASGMSLVETLVALVLFTTVALSIAPAFTTHTDANTRSERRAEAVLLAQRRLEAMRAVDVGAMPQGGLPQSETVVLDGSSYEVRTHYCLDDAFCPPDSPGSRHLVVEVYLEGKLLYDAATVYTDLD